MSHLDLMVLDVLCCNSPSHGVIGLELRHGRYDGLPSLIELTAALKKFSILAFSKVISLLVSCADHANFHAAGVVAYMLPKEVEVGVKMLGPWS